jgi:hypothetical protein
VSVSARELAGAWRLVAYLDVAEADEADGDDRLDEGPLGAEPAGLLIYDPCGYMSVSMMPAAGSAARGGYMGYAGRWRLSGDEVLHEVEVSSHAHLVRTTQVRTLTLAEGLLTLRGTSLLDGRPRRRLLHWRRVADAAKP